MNNQTNDLLVQQSIAQNILLSWLSNVVIILGIPVAAVLIWCGLHTLVGTIFLTEWWTTPVSVAGIFVTLGGSVCVGVKHQMRDQRAIRALTEEQLVLAYAAARNGGSFTLASASLGSGLSIEQTQAVLHRLAKMGVCVIYLDHECGESYSFPSLRTNLPRLQAPAAIEKRNHLFSSEGD